MEWYVVLLIILAAITFFFVIPVLIMSGVLYSILLVRRKPEKWGRECSIPEDEEYRGIFDCGIAWREKYEENRREVSVVSDGLKLAGEFFDFGGDRAVIIIAGRMESLLYSCAYAEPYRAAGCSVLVIDNRAHGLSEGKVSSLGYKEYRDVLEWAKLIHDSFGVRKITLHGICIGASCALFAAVSEKRPDYIDSLCVEGMYANFYQSFLNHMKADRPNTKRFPILQGVMVHIRVISGANVVTDGPYKRIVKLKLPVLFIHSREDKYSLPALTEEMYGKCRAPKRIVWFEHGAHSRLRAGDPEKYDRAVTEFLRDLPDVTAANNN